MSMVAYILYSALFCGVLKSVKKTVVCILVLGICLPSNFIHAAVSTSALVAHYFHHITDHEYISVRKFLELHSEDNAHMQADADEHHNLPGADHQHNCEFIQLLPALTGNTFLGLVLPERLTTTQPDFVQQYIPSSASGSIWQPPKLG